MAYRNTILLVEDNPDDEALTLRAFKKHGVTHEVVVVRNGVEALDYLFATGSYVGRDPDDLPLCVLLDLQLPIIDGLEVLRRLRANERTRLIPVIMLTSSREPQDIRDSYSLGANSYVAKPIDYVQYTEAVRQIGVYWLVVNETLPGRGLS